jgi:hypothetical protein
MGDIRRVIEKAERGGNFLSRALTRIYLFFAKRAANANRAAMFRNINKLSLLEKFKFKIARRNLDKIYSAHIRRLQNEAKLRKIRVAFLVNSVEKWYCGYLYGLFESSENFEPMVLVSEMGDCGEKFDGSTSFFSETAMHIFHAYDAKKNEYLDFAAFKPDIVFYEQPWGIDSRHGILAAANFALTCYTPYCFHMMDSSYNYLEKFHRFLWKYFVEDRHHAESYKFKFNAENCTAVGSLHLDGYFSTKEPSSELWADKSGVKKRIIYAPHFTLDDSYMVATFRENWQFILNLASMFPETTWVVKPHPHLNYGIVRSGMMTRRELDDYYAQWKKYGTVFIGGGNYADLFRTSDCMITDCISFLADYFPTGKPVFHLRSDRQAADFNAFGKKIIGTYYQIHSNAELERLFSQVVIDGDDFMKCRRDAQLKDLGILERGSAGKRVFDYIKSELKIL